MDRLYNWVDTRRNIFLSYVGALPRPFLESVFFYFFSIFSFFFFSPPFYLFLFFLFPFSLFLFFPFSFFPFFSFSLFPFSPFSLFPCSLPISFSSMHCIEKIRVQAFQARLGKAPHQQNGWFFRKITLGEGEANTNPKHLQYWFLNRVLYRCIKILVKIYFLTQTCFCHQPSKSRTKFRVNCHHHHC